MLDEEVFEASQTTDGCERRDLVVAGIELCEAGQGCKSFQGPAGSEGNALA